MNIKLIGLAVGVVSLLSCGRSESKPETQLSSEEIAVFTSTDTLLQKSYEWARKMALSYAHDADDPVGAWYEAALPQREAFCMRDVSHQTVGAHILGLAKHNKNMMHKFASNISEERDWCSFWEINRYNKPAPADYTSDSEFWYNLNANFDVMQACLKMYEWTGDTDYLNGEGFADFYARSVSDYIDRWQLQPEKIMDRPPYMNCPADFNIDNNFHSCRGLPSYVENFRGLTVGVDLLATLNGGYLAYSRISELNGDKKAAAEALEKAARYRELIDTRWWDVENSRFHTFWTAAKEFYRGEGIPFILWFNASDHPERLRACVDDILSSDWNVENMSAFPALFYQLGYNNEAYRYLTLLPTSDRSEYPEVSFGLIEGIVCGAMGVTPSASEKSIATLSRIADKECSVSNLPVLDGYISVNHKGMHETSIENNTSSDLIWRVSFQGCHSCIACDGRQLPALRSKDLKGNDISTVEITLPKNSGKHVAVPVTEV